MNELSKQIEDVMSGQGSGLHLSRTAREFALPILCIASVMPEQAKKIRFFLARFGVTDAAALEATHIKTDAIDLEAAASRLGRPTYGTLDRAVLAVNALVLDTDVLTTHSHEAIAEHVEGSDHWFLLAYRVDVLQYVADKMGIATLDKASWMRGCVRTVCDFGSYAQVPRKLAKLCARFGGGVGGTKNPSSLMTLPMLHGVFTYTAQARIAACSMQHATCGIPCIDTTPTRARSGPD